MLEQLVEIRSDKPSVQEVNGLPAPFPTNLNQADPVASNQTPPSLEAADDTALVEPPTKPSLPTPPPAKLKQQVSNLRLQPVEILTSAGSWVGGYFVHSCIAVANLINQERHFTLFDADGKTYSFWGQIRPPQNMAGAT